DPGRTGGRGDPAMASLRVAVLVLVLAGSGGTVNAQTPAPGTSQIAPSEASQKCVGQFKALRAEVEKRGIAARRASEKHASRGEVCKLLPACGGAERKWIKYRETNTSKCDFQKECVAQVRTVHAKTADGQTKLCRIGARLEDVREDDQNYLFGPPTQ